MKLATLRKIKQLNNISDINRGGCGIAAIAIKKLLDQDNPGEAKIVYILDSFDKVDRFHLSDGPISCQHAVVVYKNRYIDSTGVISNKRMQIQWGSQWEISRPLSEQQAVLSASTVRYNDENLWNRAFDRRAGIPLIEEISGMKLNITIGE